MQLQIFFFIGVIVGIGCIVAAIIMGGAQISSFIDVQSLFIVIGGMLGATIATYPADIKKLPKLFKLAISKDTVNIGDDIDKIVELAELARKEGLLALENATEGMDDPFMKNGIMLILDGSDPELVKNVMETEVYFMADRHAVGAAMFNSMSAYSPAFGMVGTLIGLIKMLLTLEDSSTLGPNMAVALVTTFYGVIFANLIFTPLSKQLSSKSESEQLRKNMIIEGILSIQDGENPRMIRDKLLAFVSRSEASALEAKSGTTKARTSDEGGEA